MLGAGLVGVGLLVVMLLASYTPEDPSWMAASDQPVQNWLGRIGAGIASPLYVIVGRGAWLLPAGLIAWGLRLMLHRGEERALGRAIFLPIAVAMASVYAAFLVPGDEWGETFTLGGKFGDMIAGSLLSILPISGAFGVKVLTAVLGIAALVLALFVTGFTKWELRSIARFMWLGTVAAYVGLMNLLGRSASASVVAVRRAGERAKEHRAQARERAAELAAWEEQQALAAAQWQEDYQPVAPVAERPSLLSRIRRPAEPGHDALWEPELVEPQPRNLAEEPSEDRIRARIAQAVQSRKIAPEVAVPAPVTGYEAEPEAFWSDPEPAPEYVAESVPEPAPRAPASVLAAVASRLARMPRQPQVIDREPQLRAEPPLKAEPRYMPGTLSPTEPQLAQSTPRMASPESPEMPQDEPLMTAAEALRAEQEGADWQATDWATGGWQPDDNMAGGWQGAQAPDALNEEDADDFCHQAFDALDAEIPEIPAALRPELNRQVIPQAPQVAPRVVQPVKKAPAPSRRAMEEAQPRLAFEAPKHVPYEPPPLSLLMNPVSIQRHQLSDEALEENARMLEAVLDDYGVKGEIVSVRPGPVVTMYELEPAPGLKASRVIGLADDIARSMSALSARVSTVPGRSVIGIELPNQHREKVVLREILAARDFGDSNMKLPLALGKDIGGEAIVANLAKMPHLLIAGTTGSGKSVAINTMILSLLYKLSPEECRLIMIDPKMLELSVYDGIPHLLSPVVTDPKKAVVALKWVVSEMEERYRRMSKMGVRNIEGYNGRVKESLAKGEMFKRTVQTGFDEETGEPVFETEEFQPQPFPYIVVIVDEMADLMMVAGKEIEACIQRLAQMARASGIHLIMATQRPSVDVITGTIKANFPTRISFQVTSKIDSRTILGEQGAEQLLGMGDMLYMGAGSRITRIHGPFVSDEEVEEIVNHLKSFGPPAYMSGVVGGPDDEVASDIDAVLGLNSGGNTTGEDALYDQAVAIVIKDRKCSTSYIQRKLGIGYNKAARLVEQMEEQGVVTPANHVGKREILVPEQ